MAETQRRLTEKLLSKVISSADIIVIQPPAPLTSLAN